MSAMNGGGGKPVCQICKRMALCLELTQMHIRSLRDAWERGSLTSCDGMNGARANLNADVDRDIYKRSELLNDDLISVDEYAELAQDHAAVARLEGYDAALKKIRDATGQTIREQCAKIDLLQSQLDNARRDLAEGNRQNEKLLEQFRADQETIRELRERQAVIAQKWLNVSSECDELRPIKAERDELRSQLAVGDANMLTVQRYAERLEGELALVETALKTLYPELRRLADVAQMPLSTVGALLRRQAARSAPETGAASEAPAPAGQPTDQEREPARGIAPNPKQRSNQEQSGGNEK